MKLTTKVTSCKSLYSYAIVPSVCSKERMYDNSPVKLQEHLKEAIYRENGWLEHAIEQISRRKVEKAIKYPGRPLCDGEIKALSALAKLVVEVALCR